MKHIFIAILLAGLMSACSSTDVAHQTQGVIIANQLAKADNDGTGEGIGQLASLLVVDREYRLSGWVVGGLIGSAIEDNNQGNVSELIIRLDNGKVINLKLDVYSKTFKEGDKVSVSLNKYGEPLDVQIVT